MEESRMWLEHHENNRSVTSEERSDAERYKEELRIIKIEQLIDRAADDAVNVALAKIEQNRRIFIDSKKKLDK